MSELNIYKLHFSSALHIGTEKEDYGISNKVIDSDTLYAALTSCLAKLGEEIPQNGDLGFCVSNMFPYFQQSKESTPVYFFPKSLRQELPELKDVSIAKVIKKVTWLDINYFTKYINGYKLYDQENEINDIKGSYLTQCVIDKDFIQSQVSGRAEISRTGKEDATPFYMDRVYFKYHSGLYFIAIGDTSLLEKSLRMLSLEGIGTDRNIGNGFFEYEKDTIDLQVPTNCKYAISMSNFIPSSKEELSKLLDGDKVSYDFRRRGGWITDSGYNTLRKNSINSFLAGSVFKMEIDKIEEKGTIFDLNPDNKLVNHPIFRSGKSIFIPYNI